jgi:hypothetical protein
MGRAQSNPIRSRADPAEARTWAAQAPPIASCHQPEQVLRNRRHRLYGVAERTQAIIAEIQAELSRREPKLTGPPQRRGKPLPFNHNELPRLCLNVLQGAGQPMHVREITAVVLTGKNLDPLDRALVDATVKQMRDVLLLLKRKRVPRPVGLQRARSARWALVEPR